MQNITVYAYVTIVCGDYIHCRRLLPTGYTRTQPLQHISGNLFINIICVWCAIPRVILDAALCDAARCCPSRSVCDPFKYPPKVLPSCYGSACKMAVKLRDGFQGDLSP